MNYKRIKYEIYTLAKSQGFYGRLYDAICEVEEQGGEAFEELKEKLEAQNFKDVVDMVLYFEC